VLYQGWGERWPLGTLAGFGTRRFDRDGANRVPMFTLASLLDADFRIPSSVDYATFLRLSKKVDVKPVVAGRIFDEVASVAAREGAARAVG